MRRRMIWGAMAGLALLVLWSALVPDGADAQGPDSGGPPTPEGLKVTIVAELLNPDGSFIPPERVVYQAVATWALGAGFAGRYEVEWARQRRGEDGPVSYSRVTMVEASAAVNGELRVAENITFADAASARWCYRVRTITVGTPAPGGPPVVAMSPWAEACSVLPPTSGPAPLVAPAAARMGNRYGPRGTDPDYETIAGFGWTPVPDFSGAYEVERAYVPVNQAGSAARNYSYLATVTSAPGPDGWIEFEERVPYVVMWDNPPCYRVRAVRGDERGPYSAERCARLPTDQRPPVRRQPLAPDAGSGEMSERSTSRTAPLPLAMLAGAAALAGIWSVWSRRRR